MKHAYLGCFARAFVFGSVATAQAAFSFTLNMSQLPSAQGWTYNALGNSVPESNIFSVSGGVLHQNSIGVGFAGAGDNFYQIYNLPGFDPSLPLLN